MRVEGTAGMDCVFRFYLQLAKQPGEEEENENQAQQVNELNSVWGHFPLVGSLV